MRILQFALCILHFFHSLELRTRSLRDGTFVKQATLHVGRGPLRLSARDFDQDGWPDLSVLTYYDRSVVRLKTVGAGFPGKIVY